MIATQPPSCGMTPTVNCSALLLRRVGFCAGIVALLTIIVLAAGMIRSGNLLDFGKDFYLDEASFTPDHLRLVEKLGRVTLPHGCQGLNLQYEGAGLDDEVLARVQVPEAGVAGLRQQIQALENNDKPLWNAESEQSWYNPERLTERTSDVSYDDGERREVSLGQLGGHWYLLLRWSEM